MAGGSETILVVRHALAGVKLADPRADFERRLDTEGRASAETLPDAILDHVFPAALVSSPFVRCVETLLPLAGRLSLPVRAADGLLPSASAHRTTELLLEVPDRTVVCTHGETITRLFEGRACEKGGFWVVRRERGTLRPEQHVAAASVGDLGVLAGALSGQAA